MVAISTDTPVVLDTEDVAKLLGVSVRTIDRLVSRGEFPAGFKVGAQRRWHRDTILNLLRGTKQVSPRGGRIVRTVNAQSGRIKRNGGSCNG